MHELLTLTLKQLSATLLAKQASPVELMQAVFDRIDATNHVLNAVVAMLDRQRLMEQARAAEARIARGQGRVLEGIPLGVKDLEDVEGLPTTYGSVPFADHMPRRSSTQVQRLQAAGAIALGKTNTPELGATAYTKNLLFGPSRNPWDPAFSPGGSSGGSSAALAAQMLPLVTGSDGGGSVRIPACLVGAFGLKPSHGRIPMGPEDRWRWIDTECHGPITKTVADAALFLDQVAGPSPQDDKSLPPPTVRYADAVETPLEGKLRVGYFPDLGEVVVQQEVAEAVETRVRALERQGHRIDTVQGGPPNMGAAWVYINNLNHYCALQHLLPQHEADFGRGFIAAVKSAVPVDPQQLETFFQRRTRLNAWCAEAFADHDVLVMPTVAYDGHSAKGPYPDTIDGKPASPLGPGAFTIAFNLSLHPAATLRAGLSRRGLPMGIQVVGPRHRDDLVLQVARALEREHPAHPHWPTPPTGTGDRTGGDA